LLDIPGNAINKPIVIESNAAIIDSKIVEEKPPAKKTILFQPDLVEGSITYQPHMSEDEHPDNNKMASRSIYFFIFKILFKK
jgi:hypothetical protein